MDRQYNHAEIAARDIQPGGEELTCDYRVFDADPFYGFENN